MATQVVYATDTSDMLIPHGLFRTAFGTAEAILEGAAGAGAERAAAVHSYFDNILRFLVAHHEGEDAIVWPVLTERCPEAAEVITRMEGEHAAIHGLGERAAAALEAYRTAPGPDTGRELAAALDALWTPLAQHFHEEEEEILPLASRSMSPEEWGALPAHAMAHFTGDKIWLVLGLIFEQMRPEQLASTFKLLPPPVVEMWQTSGDDAFRSFVSIVRGVPASPDARAR